MATWNGQTLVPMPTSPPAPRSIEWLDTDISSANVSPFTASQQIYQWLQGYMEASLSYPVMPLAQATPWIVFLRLLQGINGVFLWGDPQRSAPQNPLATAPSVSGGGQTGFSLITTGGSHQTVGDYISIPGTGVYSTGQRLYMITSISGGTFGIYPPIRESPANAQAITITNPVGVWKLKSTARKYDVDVQRNMQFSFEIKEAL